MLDNKEKCYTYTKTCPNTQVMCLLYFVVILKQKKQKRKHLKGQRIIKPWEKQQDINQR